ncbi:MAG TPA: hypothetical protein VGH74_17420, partial [Planctomycetaceae bacterium]
RLPVPGLLPHRFLFRYALPIRYESKLPRSGKRLLDLSGDFALPDFGGLDNAISFGQLRLAWNERGLGISLEVKGKRRPPICEPHAPESADGLRVYIDTRNTQNIHRASRYCHQFGLFPCGALTGTRNPWAVQIPILRAREEASLANPGTIRVWSVLSKTGYCLETWLPAAVLYGYDSEAQPRLGFYFALRDAELGEQFLSVGADFPFAIDPSLWSTLELVGKDT